jgi:ribosome-associated protein
MSETAAKKDTAKLQRAIIDGLEDVKAQDIQVFDTEHLSSLFERVIVASGTSNRQTKALASSVRDAVRMAGFPKPRIEGEENGEWIIVDCGACVAHVMQPAIRQYYHLEEIWGEKPVRLKLGAAKPATPVAVKLYEEKVPKAQQNRAQTATKKIAPKAKPGIRSAPASAAPVSVKAAVKKVVAKKVATTKAGASKTAAKPAVKPAIKPATKAVAKKVPAKKSRA